MSKKRRLELHEILVEVLGNENVYFTAPPPTMSMSYPCIVYKRNNSVVNHADDRLYKNRIGYMATVIDPDPDSEIPDRIRELQYCRFERHYTADNLNHDVFNIYY